MEERGVAVHATSNDRRDMVGVFTADSIVDLLAGMDADEWVDVHGPDTRRLDTALSRAGVACRTEESREPVTFGQGEYVTRRYWGAGQRTGEGA